METELRPINDMDLNPPHLIHDDMISDNEPRQRLRDQDDFTYYQPSFQQQQQQQVNYDNYQDKKDMFTNLDKTAYVVIFVAFILGFFMGKTMQPVILRPG